jgi:hypothetical protein
MTELKRDRVISVIERLIPPLIGVTVGGESVDEVTEFVDRFTDKIFVCLCGEKR